MSVYGQEHLLRTKFNLYRVKYTYTTTNKAKYIHNFSDV